MRFPAAGGGVVGFAVQRRLGSFWLPSKRDRRAPENGRFGLDARFLTRFRTGHAA